MPGPAALARSLGYAFLCGGTDRARPHAGAELAGHERDRSALAGGAGLPGGPDLPSRPGPPAELGAAAALALATILVTYAVEFFSDPGGSVWAIFYVAVAMQAGYFLSRWLAAAQVALVAVTYGLVMWGHESAFEMLDRHRRDGRARRLDGRDDALAASPPDHRASPTPPAPTPTPASLNRRGLQEISELELERAQRGERPVSIVDDRRRSVQGLQRGARPLRLRPRAQDARGAWFRRTSAASTSPPGSAARSSRCWRPTPTSTAPTSSPTGCGARFARRSPAPA